MFKIPPKGTNATALDREHFKKLNQTYELVKNKQDLSSDNELTLIGNKYKDSTDKIPLCDYWRKHNYTEFYGPLFNRIRNDKLKIVEIGVRWGGSILMWLDYFPNAEIYCFEINLKQLKVELPKTDRLKVFEGNAYDENFVKKKLENEKFDIIFDDGSHNVNDQIKFFNIYKNYIKKNGYMLCEDFPSRDNLIKVINNFKGKRNNMSIIDRTNCIPSGRGELILLYID